jgi:hypothetical protein
MLVVRNGATSVVDTRASGFVPFLKALYAALSWPTIVLAPLVQWPLARFLWRLLRQPTGAASPAAWIVAATGVWIALLAVLLAWGRGYNPLMARYTSYYLIGLVVNLWALLAALPPRDTGRKAARLATAWVVVILVALATSVGRDLLVVMSAPLNASIAAADLRAYVASGDAETLRPRHTADLLYDPHPEVMRAILDNPTVRRILPPALLPANASREPAALRWLLENLKPLGLLLLTASLALALRQGLTPARTG